MDGGESMSRTPHSQLNGSKMTNPSSSRSRVDLEPTPLDARTALGIAMIERYLPRRPLDAIRRREHMGIVIIVPSAQHGAIVAEGLDHLMGLSDYVLEMTGEPNLYTAEKLVKALAGGGTVVAIGTALQHIPVSFRALADGVHYFGRHDAKMLMATMRAVMPGVIPAFPKGFVPSGSPDLLCRCIDPGLSPKRVIRALTELSDIVARSVVTFDVPDLEHAVEFGAVRDWGLQVKRDVEAWQAGSLLATDLDTAVLISGNTGTGKTLFSRVLAKSMSIPLFELTLGSAIAGDGHLGNVIANLRERFDEASEAAPSILLLDEFDSVLSRDADSPNAAFVTGVINEMLSLLDGATVRRPGLIIIATTNRPEAIDAALLRPGRIGTHLRLGLPHAQGVESILRFHLKSDLLAEPLDEIVRLAMWCSPARLMDVVRAARRLARNERRPIERDDLRRPLLASADEDFVARPRISVHEAGHAMASLMIPDAPILRSVSLMPIGHIRGNILTSDLPGVMTRSRLEAKVMMVLAGRAAETLVYGGDFSDGATEDLHQATMLMARMHARGMGESLVYHQDVESLLLIDGEFRTKVEGELQRLMQSTLKLLEPFEDGLLALADELCSRHVISAAEALEVVLAASEEEDPMAGWGWYDYTVTGEGEPMKHVEPEPNPGTVQYRNDILEWCNER